MQEKQTLSSRHEPEESRDGFIYLADKPLDYTSADIVRIFKKNLNLKKIGHAGTLDPKATGLLILCSGKKTKRINEFIEFDKEYEGIIRLGATTKSFDTESEEENVHDEIEMSDEELQKVCDLFKGETEQIPPMYSAVKHKGKPLYKMARKGREIKREPRKIFISDFQVKMISGRDVMFRISCSKGTYIRTIADDFGRKLGVGGYLKELRRTRIGRFFIEGLDLELKGIRYRILEE